MLAVDAGARYGIHPTLNRLGRHCEYLLFEPEREEWERLNAKYANHENVHIEKLGLGSENYSTALGRTSHAALSSCLELSNELVTQESRIRQYKKDETQEIEIRRLDDYLEKDGDFLKLDIEGMELDALKGAGSILKTFTGIRCEAQLKKTFACKNSGTLSDIDKWLEERDFEMISIDNILAGRQTSKWSANKKDGVLINCDAVWRNQRIMDKISDGSSKPLAAKKMMCWHFINSMGGEAIRIFELALKSGIKMDWEGDNCDKSIKKLMLEHALAIYNSSSVELNQITEVYRIMTHEELPRPHLIRYEIDKLS